MSADGIPNAGAGVCIVIPAFREQSRIGPVVTAARGHGADVVVIDDGSPDATAVEAEAAGAFVIRHPVNRGKGMALATGFEFARAHGYVAVITMDADGQHDPAEIAKFLEAFRRTGLLVLVGNRMWDPHGMPWVRFLTNMFMSWMLSREMKQYVPDTQCGFRLFRCDVIPYVGAKSERFAAESEILLHVAARGMQIGSVRVSTIYRGEKSKINPFLDTWRFFGMLRAHRRGRRAPRPAAAGKP